MSEDIKIKCPKCGRYSTECDVNGRLTMIDADGKEMAHPNFCAKCCRVNTFRCGECGILWMAGRAGVIDGDLCDDCIDLVVGCPS